MFSFEVPSNELLEVLSVPLHRARLVMAHIDNNDTVNIRALGDITDIASGAYIDEYVPYGLLYLRVDNIRPFICTLNADDVVYVNPDALGVTKRVLIQSEDVLIARTGTLGKASLAVGPLVGSVMSQHVTRLTCSENGPILPGYLAAFLNSEEGRNQLLYSGFGSTRLELTHKALRAIKIPIINIEIQKEIHTAIAYALKIYYEAISLFNQAVTQLEDAIGFIFRRLPQELWFETQVGYLDELWTPRYYYPPYQELITWLQEYFECISLSKLATIERGKGTRVSEYAQSGVPFVRTSSLINFGIDPFPDYYASDELVELFNQPVLTGDILVSMEGKIGQCAYLTAADVCVFKNHIELVRCSVGFDPMYVFLVLSSRLGRFQLDQQTVIQATIPGLGDRLRNVAIPTGPKHVARKIDFVNQVKSICAVGYKAAHMREEAISKMRETICELETRFLPEAILAQT